MFPFKNLIIISFSLLLTDSNAQSIGINSTGVVAHPSALLDVDASPTNAKGFLMPRLTNVQRKAIVAPAIGLQVYDVTLKGFYVFDGTKWDCVTTPAGTFNYFCNTIAPNGYLECNGQAVNRTNYAELFTAIGTIYGIGDGATTFNVPDLRGEFLRGVDNGRGVDAGRTLGSFEQASTHKELGGAGGVGTINNYWSDNKANVVSDAPVVVSPVPTNGGTLTSPYDTNKSLVVMYEFTHRPRNIALLPCIKF